MTEILGVGEHAGVAGVPAHYPARHRVVDLGDERLPVSLDLGRGAEPRQSGGVADSRIVDQREIARVPQSENIEDVSLGIFIKPLSRDSFEDSL